MSNLPELQVISEHDYAKMAIYNGVNIDFKQYRSAALLPELAWKYIDEVVTRVGREEHVGITDLKNAPGVVKQFDAMTADVYLERRSSGVNRARVATTPDNRGEGQKQDYETFGVPLLVTFQEYIMDTKKARMAARIGLPIDTNLAEECSYSVAQFLEQTLFNGVDFDGNAIKGHGYQVYGYTNFPDRSETTIADWSSADPDVIVDNVIAMMKASRLAKFNGPWTLYIPWDYQERLDADYLTKTSEYPVSGTIEQRLMSIKGITAIKVSDYLADNNVVLAELKPRSIRLIEGMPIRTMAWEAPNSPNWRKLFKVMAITVPFLKADYNGNSGIVHGHL